nr:manganese-dependent ADP-ribose/CDP-alcohol diphosphatase isoform X2 [Parasteatoda tepidariorum]
MRNIFLISFLVFIMTLEPKTTVEPLVTFGVLTDVQYADCEDRPAPHDSSKTRFYRKALDQVDAAFKSWKESHKVKFVLQLGDIIDGLNRKLGGSYSSLRDTLEHFEYHASIPTFHSVGNHELYNFNRNELALLFYESVKKLDIPVEVFCPLNPAEHHTPVLYYKFCPVPNLKFISLDCFDVSVLGYDVDHPNYQMAAKILSSKHGHNVFEDWDCDGDLKGLDVRFQQMNGAVGEDQKAWLNNELRESDELGQRVIVFGHVGLYPDSTDWNCLLWNYNEIIQIFHQHKCVLAYFCGHTHESGYAVDSHGISYVVFTGIVETPPDSPAFATVSLYEDQLKIIGHGLEQSYVIPFKNDNLNNCDESIEEKISNSPAVKVEV